MRNIYADKGAEHQHIVSTFKRMIKDIKFVDEKTKQERVLDLPDIWKSHSNIWLREKGIEKTDTGEIDGTVPDDIKSMEVNQNINNIIYNNMVFILIIPYKSTKVE